MVRIRTMTVAEYNQEPPSFKIIHGCPVTPFGKCYLGVTSTDKAVVHLTFPAVNTFQDRVMAKTELQRLWPKTELTADAEHVTDKIADKIFDEKGEDAVSILMKGTEFQLKVWQSLTNIPPGTTTTYEKVAESIGKPKAARAIGNAVMQNKIGYLVPCHRVMGKSGSSKYSWGPKLKQSILDYENNNAN